MNKKTTIAVIIFVIFLVLFLGIIVFNRPKTEVTNVNNPDEAKDIDKVTATTTRTEVEQLHRIGESPSQEEIYSNPYIKHIRVALNGYLDGSNSGVEMAAIGSTKTDIKCGLNNFSKAYYRSKFVILETFDNYTLDNGYGGIQAYIAFIDKPETMFWVLVYRLDGNGAYVLGIICENPPIKEDKEIFDAFINEMIQNSEFYL